MNKRRPASADFYSESQIPMKIAGAGTGSGGLANAILLTLHDKVVDLDVLPEKVALPNQKKSPSKHYLKNLLAEAVISMSKR